MNSFKDFRAEGVTLSLSKGCSACLFLDSVIKACFPLFLLKEKVEQKVQEKSKCSAALLQHHYNFIVLLSSIKL